jgi:hypothetical protein
LPNGYDYEIASKIIVIIQNNKNEKTKTYVATLIGYDGRGDIDVLSI